MAISLNQFINVTKDECIDIPGGNGNSGLAGECVSLVQKYLFDCFNIPFIARGHAAQWITTLPAEGIASTVTNLQVGDIVVCPTKANGTGHIGIYIGSLMGGTRMMYEQNYQRDEDTVEEARTARAVRSFDDFIKTEGVQVPYTILRINKVAGAADLEGIYLVAKNGAFNMRSVAGTGSILDVVPKGSQAQILEFRPGFIAASDGKSYQWALVQYNSKKGYAQLDLEGDYLLKKQSGSSRLYLKAVTSSFDILLSKVNGIVATTVPVGARAEISSVDNNYESDGLQWCSLQYGNSVGYAKMNTIGYTQLEK